MDYTDLNSGALKYYGLPCRKGHDGLRYTRTDNCVHCSVQNGRKYRDTRLRSAIRAEEESVAPYAVEGRAMDRKARLMAKSEGKTTYVGRQCKKCDTHLRYVTRGSCVECRARGNQRVYDKRTRNASEVLRVQVDAFVDLLG